MIHVYFEDYESEYSWRSEIVQPKDCERLGDLPIGLYLINAKDRLGEGVSLKAMHSTKFTEAYSHVDMGAYGAVSLLGWVNLCKSVHENAIAPVFMIIPEGAIVGNRFDPDKITPPSWAYFTFYHPTEEAAIMYWLNVLNEGS